MMAYVLFEYISEAATYATILWHDGYSKGYLQREQEIGKLLRAATPAVPAVPAVQAQEPDIIQEPNN